MIVGRVGCGGRQIRDGLGLVDALEVDVPRPRLLLLPGHVQEGSLHEVVDHLPPPRRPQLQLVETQGISC